MKLKFKISKLACQYFFISNLSEWHFSNRLIYNKIWLEQSGGALNNEEKSAIRLAHDLIKNSIHYGRPFFLYDEKKAWNIIENEIGDKDAQKFKEVFNILGKRFDKIWNLSKLKKWERNLISVSKSSSVLNLFKNIDDLFNLKSNQDFTVFLLPSPINGKHPAGGANLNSDAITLEVPVDYLENRNWLIEAAIAISVHEIIHILIERPNFKSLVNSIFNDKNIKKDKLTSQTRKSEEVIKEIISASFAPTGYLIQKNLKNYSPLFNTTYFSNLDKSFAEFLKFKKGIKYEYKSLEPYIVWQLFPLVSDYVKNGKKIDKKFISEITNLLF